MNNSNNILVEIPKLDSILAISSANHKRLCPRQVLGVRMGLAGQRSVFAGNNINARDLLVIIETDGCFADGIMAATGAQIGHRTLRVEDYGKVAATFINTKSGQAVRIHPKVQVREHAQDFAPEEQRRYFAMLEGYQIMPEEQLLQILPVRLTQPLDEIISRPGIRSKCEQCDEEIINQREVLRDGITLCISCAGRAYYEIIS